MGEIWLVRHGETEWSRTGQHTGRTDLPLLPEGEAAARELKGRLQRPWALVLSSPLQRARHTAELAGLTPELDDDLMEWDYGPAEGKRTRDMGPGWSVWDDVPLGETLKQVAARARRVLNRVPEQGDTCLVAHGHVLRVLTAVYLELEPRDARHLVLQPCGIGVLGHEHDCPALTGWNQ
ncbi:MAG: histidine phosphatase family protein [Frankiales bacterium]|nr:histidine phosphatase family protein [Frankiales bacterium]